MKRKNKVILLFFALFMTIGLFSNTKPVKADMVISSYFYNTDLIMLYDINSIWLEKATDNNYYRNCMDSGKLVPKRSIDDANGFLKFKNPDSQATNTTLHQFYFDGLDNQDVFRSESINELIFNETIDIFRIINGTNTQNGTLDKMDLDTTNFISTINGTYPATWSFTNETNGIVPNDWIHTGTDGIGYTIEKSNFHRKVLINGFPSGTSGSYMSNYNLSNSYGIVEFWIQVDTTNKLHNIELRDGVNTKSVFLAFANDGNMKYYDGSWHIIQSYNANQWYHFKIKFDCSTYGDGTNDWHLWIDQIEKSPSGGYNFRGSPIEMDWFIESAREQPTNAYLDGIGYDWLGYISGTNLNPIESELNLTSKIQVDTPTLNEMSLFKLKYAYKTNIEQIINFSIYNYENNEYELINSSSNNNGFYKCGFEVDINPSNYFNESNYLKLKFEGINQTNNFTLMLDYFMLEIYNSTKQYDGYFKIRSRIIALVGMSLMYNILNNFYIYKNYITLNGSMDYVVGSGSDFSYSKKIYNTTIMKTVEFTAIYSEFQYNSTHMCNRFKIDMYINGISVFSENYNSYDTDVGWDKYLSNEIIYYNDNFFYESDGYYGYSQLKGIRCLYSPTEFKTDFPKVPLFLSTIDIEPKEIIPYNPEEPDKPEGTDYWNYQSYEIKFDTYESLTVENWTVEYPLMTVSERTNKFYYELISKKSLGDWGIFNFIRDFFAWLLNIGFVFIQFLMYLLVIAFNFIIVYLLVGVILAFIWNIVLKFLFVALIWILWFLYIGLVWIWKGLVWVYENLIVPFAEWFINVGLPLIIEIIVIVFAFILALIIWLGTLCQGDFDAIYEQCHDILSEIADFLVETTVVLITNIPAIMLYILMYVLLTFECLLKHVYCKSKGYVNRSVQLKESLEAYMYPINATKDIIIKIKELLGRWT